MEKEKKKNFRPTPRIYVNYLKFALTIYRPYNVGARFFPAFDTLSPVKIFMSHRISRWKSHCMIRSFSSFFLSTRVFTFFFFFLIFRYFIRVALTCLSPFFINVSSNIGVGRNWLFLSPFLYWQSFCLTFSYFLPSSRSLFFFTIVIKN